MIPVDPDDEILDIPTPVGRLIVEVVLSV